MKYRYITATLLLLATVIQAAAQALTDRYTRQHPVVVTCQWEDPPYEFLNDEGNPAGMNVDIIKAVMENIRMHRLTASRRMWSPMSVIRGKP